MATTKARRRSRPETTSARTPRELVELLNARLADTFDLYGQAKQAHWIVRGSDFFQLHELYDSVAEACCRSSTRSPSASAAGRALAAPCAWPPRRRARRVPARRDRRPGHRRGRRRPARRLRCRGARGDRHGRRELGDMRHLGPVHRDLAHDRQAPLVRRGAPAGGRLGCDAGRAASACARPASRPPAGSSATPARAARGSSPTRAAGVAAPAREPELGEDAARLRRPGVLARPPLVGEPGAELVVGVRRVEHAPDDELRRDRAVPAVLLEPEGDVEARLGACSRSSWAPCPNAIAEPPSRPCWRTRKRRCLPSPTVLRGSIASTPATSSVGSGLPSPNGARRSSSCARSSVSAAGGHDRVDGRERPQVGVREHGVGVRARTRPRTPRAARSRS